MKLDARIKKRIEKYQPKGNLDHTSKFFLLMAEAKHSKVKAHCQRVALLAEQVAEKHKKDKKAAFFAGLLHDTGKIVLPENLFDGHNIDSEEYAKIKEHALIGFNILKGMPHLFTALCAGIHHNVYKAGYGLGIKDFPDNFSVETVKKILEVSTIVFICDFIDAFSYRKTKIRDGSDKISSQHKQPTLREMLKVKYPNDHTLIETALKCQKSMKY